MLISGIQPFTLLDYPGKTACIIFIPGCNFRCGFCHNPEFVIPEKIIQIKDSFISEEAVFNFLLERRGLLDGVVITGGEPTTAPDLVPFMQKIRRLGFLVKLDTNGNRPDVIAKALQERVVDYIAMDVKTDLNGYKKLVGPLIRTDNIKNSINLIKNSTIQYEFRSTLLKEIHTDSVLEKMAELVDGAQNWFLQKFRPDNTLAPTFTTYHPFTDEEIKTIADRFKKNVQRIFVR